MISVTRAMRRMEVFYDGNKSRILLLKGGLII